MKIFLATDHAGFELKQKLIPFLQELGHEVIDKGATTLDENDDYPDFIAEAAREVSESAGDKNVCGIVLGGSGQGEAIVANKFPGVRAVVFNGQYEKNGRDIPDEIFLTRSHNDSNVLSLGARFLSDEETFRAVREWLDTPFSDEDRHIRRIAKIAFIEQNLKQQ